MAKWFKQNKDPLTFEEKMNIIENSSKQVGPGVFYSTIIVVTSFLPVFLLTGMEGKLFSPLAWTKTFILLIDAFLAITLMPVLISFFLTTLYFGLQSGELRFRRPGSRGARKSSISLGSCYTATNTGSFERTA